jgi:hypothetical protein
VTPYLASIVPLRISAAPATTVLAVAPPSPTSMTPIEGRTSEREARPLSTCIVLSADHMLTFGPGYQLLPPHLLVWAPACYMAGLFGAVSLESRRDVALLCAPSRRGPIPRKGDLDLKPPACHHPVRRLRPTLAAVADIPLDDTRAWCIAELSGLLEDLGGFRLEKHEHGRLLFTDRPSDPAGFGGGDGLDLMLLVSVFPRRVRLDLTPQDGLTLITIRGRISTELRNALVTKFVERGFTMG